MSVASASVEQPTAAEPQRIDLLTRIRHEVSDGLVMTWRNLMRWVRLPQLLVVSTIQPIMFVLLFNFVFGGPIDIPGIDNYIDFLLAGIFVQATTFGATQTGVALAEDLDRGVIDRFRSLPMSRSAVLAGRTTADAVRGLFVVLLMTVIGSLIGFRFGGTVLGAVAAIGIVVAFGFALSWVAAVVGMSMRSPEAAQAASFVWVFPLVFASSAFVPTQTMPPWLAAFAENQPVSAVANAARALMLGEPGEAIAGGSAGELSLRALLWIAAIIAVAFPLAIRRYRRAV